MNTYDISQDTYRRGMEKLFDVSTTTAPYEGPYSSRSRVAAEDITSAEPERDTDTIFHDETSALESGRFMSELKLAAAEASAKDFTERVLNINWTAQTGEDLAEAIQLCLSKGGVSIARKLTEIATNEQTENKTVSNMKAILREPSTSPLPSSSIDVKANNQWLRDKRDQYLHNWVALKNGTLVADGENLAQVLDTLGENRDENLLITKVY